MGRNLGRAAAIAALGTAAGLVMPVAAAAATRTVEAGPFTRAAQKAFMEGASADANAYFRRVVTIRRGDTVSWDINGFHSVTFVPRGEVDPFLAAPDPANPVTGVLDAAGNPFWFNGQPRLVLNPAAALPQGGRNFRPSRLISSGLPLSESDEPPPPYRLKFNRTGRFGYICTVHPGMKGAVRVVGAKRRIPSARANRRQALREQRSILRRAQRRTTGIGTTDLVNTAQAGNDDRLGTAIFKFFPENLRVKTGTTVRLRMSPNSTEVHSFTFGPSNGKDLYLDQLAEGFIQPAPGGGDGPPTLLFDPRAAYPSENPASGTPSYDGANHGNGFYNTGLLDRGPDTPLPPQVRVTFTRAGTYGYICIVHPFMRGTVTVTD